jgi:hypothetical protein
MKRIWMRSDRTKRSQVGGLSSAFMAQPFLFFNSFFIPIALFQRGLGKNFEPNKTS